MFVNNNETNGQPTYVKVIFYMLQNNIMNDTVSL